MKVIITAVFLLVVMTRCSDNDPPREFDGRLTGPPDGYNTLYIFKEDNLAGSTVKNDVNRHLRKDYQVSAYRVLLKDSTVITDGKGNSQALGEMAHPSQSFLHNRRVTVSVAEDWEKEWTDLNRYIRYQPRFLPAYTAEKIILEPFILDDFARFHAPLNENTFKIVTFYRNEDDIPFSGSPAGDITPSLLPRQQVKWESYYLFENHPLTEEVALNPVIHLLLTSDGKKVLSPDWEDILEFFED